MLTLQQLFDPLTPERTSPHSFERDFIRQESNINKLIEDIHRIPHSPDREIDSPSLLPSTPTNKSSFKSPTRILTSTIFELIFELQKLPETIEKSIKNSIISPGIPSDQKPYSHRLQTPKENPFDESTSSIHAPYTPSSFDKPSIVPLQLPSILPSTFNPTIPTASTLSHSIGYDLKLHESKIEKLPHSSDETIDLPSLIPSNPSSTNTPSDSPNQSATLCTTESTDIDTPTKPSKLPPTITPSPNTSTKSLSQKPNLVIPPTPLRKVTNFDKHYQIQKETLKELTSIKEILRTNGKPKKILKELASIKEILQNNQQSLTYNFKKNPLPILKSADQWIYSRMKNYHSSGDSLSLDENTVNCQVSSPTLYSLDNKTYSSPSEIRSSKKSILHKKFKSCKNNKSKTPLETSSLSKSSLKSPSAQSKTKDFEAKLQENPQKTAEYVHTVHEELRKTNELNKKIQIKLQLAEEQLNSIPKSSFSEKYDSPSDDNPTSTPSKITNNTSSSRDNSKVQLQLAQEKLNSSSEACELPSNNDLETSSTSSSSSSPSPTDISSSIPTLRNILLTLPYSNDNIIKFFSDHYTDFDKFCNSFERDLYEWRENFHHPFYAKFRNEMLFLSQFYYYCKIYNISKLEDLNNIRLDVFEKNLKSANYCLKNYQTDSSNTKNTSTKLQTDTESETSKLTNKTSSYLATIQNKQYHIIHQSDSDTDSNTFHQRTEHHHSVTFNPKINTATHGDDQSYQHNHSSHEDHASDSSYSDCTHDNQDDEIDSYTQDIIDQACVETCDIIENAIVEAADHSYNAAYDECHDNFRDRSLRH